MSTLMTVCLQICQWSKKHQELRKSRSHVREVKATKMFFLIVLSLIACHGLSAFAYTVLSTTHIIHREVFMVVGLAVLANSAINFFVYYGMGKEFRDCFCALVSSKVR